MKELDMLRGKARSAIRGGYYIDVLSVYPSFAVRIELFLIEIDSIGSLMWTHQRLPIDKRKVRVIPVKGLRYIR
jgi:transcription-repair coupling factor (superfamily II helicase)